MADQKRLELVLDPSKAQSGAKLAVQAVKSVGREADITANKVGNISKAFDAVLSKLNAVNAKSPENIFKNLSTSMNQIVDANRKLQTSLDALTQKLSGVDGQIRQGAQGLTNWERVLERAKDKTTMLASEIGRQIVQEKQRHAELTKAIKLQGDSTKQLTAAELATKKLNESIAFWEQRTRDLTDAKHKDLVATREAARQLEAYQKSLVNALSPAQKLAKAENELRKEMERGRVQLDLFEKGLAQANIEQQESISIKRQLAQSQARLNNAYSDEYEQLVKNNALIRRRKQELEELHGLNGRLRKSNNSLATSFNVLGGALGTLSGGFAAIEAIRLADSYKAVGNRIAVVTGETEGLESTLNALYLTSVRSRTELDATVDVYAKMTRANEQFGYSQEEILRITETVSKAVAMSGASAQGAQGALLQFSQAISGDFQAAAQELNSLIEQTPAVADLMAKALNSVNPQLNATIGNLKRLASEGKISSEELLQGILNVSDTIDEKFAASTELVAERWRNAVDAIMMYIGETDKALNITGRISDALKDFALNIKNYSDEIDAILLGLGAALAVVTAALAGFLISLAAVPIAIASLVGGSVGAIVYFRDEIETTLKEVELAFYELLIQDIPTIINTMVDSVVDGLVWLGNSILSPMELWQSVISSTIEWIAEKFEGSIFQSALETLSMRFGLALKQIQLFFTELWSGMLTGLENAINSAVWMLNSFIQESIHKLNSLREYLGQDALVVDAITPVMFSGDSRKRVEELRTEIEALSGAVVTQMLATQDLIDEEREDLELKQMINEAASFARDSVGELTTSMESFSQSLDEVDPKKLEEALDTFIDLKSAVDPVYAKQQQLRKVWDGLQKSGKLLGISTDELNKIFVKHAMEISGANTELESMRDLYKDISFEMNPALEIQEKMNAAEKAFMQAVADGNAQLADKDMWLAKYRASIDGTAEQLEQLRDTITDTFMDGFEAAMEGGDSFKDWFKNLLKELALMAVRNQIVIPIVGQMLGMQGQGGVGGMVQQGMSMLGGQGGMSFPSSGNMTNTVNNFAAGLGFGTAGYNVYGAAGSSAISTAAGNSGMLISDLGGGQSAVMVPTDGLISQGGYVSQGLNAIGPGLAAYGFGQQYGVAGGLAAGVGSAALAGGVGGAMAGTGFMAGASGALAGLGPVGWAAIAIGALAGALGGDKGYRERGSIGTSATNRGNKWLVPNAKDGEEIQGQSAFGFTNINVNKYGDVTKYQGFLDALMGIDNAIATVFTDSIEDVKKALDGFRRGGGRGDQHSLTGQFLDDRMYIIYATIDEALFEYATSVAEAFGIEDQGSFAGVFTGLELLDRVGIDTLAEDFIEALRPMIQEGEAVGQTMIRLATSLSTVNTTLEMLGHNTFDASLAGADMASNLIDLVGGIDAFNAAASSYYQNFYSEEERFEQFADNLQYVFSGLNLELPTTTEGFRDLVEGLDLTKESDQELYAVLLKLNPQVKQYIDGLNKQRDELGQLYRSITGNDLDPEVASAFFEAVTQGGLAFEEASSRIVDAAEVMARINSRIGETTTITEGGVEYERVVSYADLSSIEEQLVAAYATALGRLPDAGGWDYYLGQIEEGLKTIPEIVAELLDSPEGAAFIETGIAQTVSDASLPDILKPIIELVEVVGEAVKTVSLNLLELAEVAGQSFSNFEQFLNRFDDEFETGFVVVEQITDALGESLDFARFALSQDSMKRFDDIAQIMLTLSERIGTVGVSADVTTASLITMSDHFRELAGSSDAFDYALSEYNKLFGSIETSTNRLSTEELLNLLDRLGVAVPTTKAEFVDLVESLDLTDASAREMYWALINVAPEMANYIDQLNRVSDAMSLDDALRAVNDAIAVQRDLIDKRYEEEYEVIAANISAAEKQLALIEEQDAALDNMRRTVDVLKDALRSMSIGTDDELRSRRMSSQRYLFDALARVRSGGELDNDLLSENLRALQEPSEGLFSTFEEYARDFYVTKGAISDLLGETQTQLTTEEQALKVARDAARADLEYYQMELDTLNTWRDTQMEQLDTLQQQALDIYNAAMGIEETTEIGTSAIVSAINTLRGLAGGAGGGAGGVDNPAPEQESLLERLQQYAMEQGGVVRWGDAFAVLASRLDTLTQDQLEQIAAGIPNFSGGTDYVNGSAQELRYTPPSSVYKDSVGDDTTNMSELVSEMKHLREDIRNGNYTIAKNTQKTAKILDRWDYDGQPEARTV